MSSRLKRKKSSGNQLKECHISPSPSSLCLARLAEVGWGAALNTTDSFTQQREMPCLRYFCLYVFKGYLKV